MKVKKSVRFEFLTSILATKKKEKNDSFRICVFKYRGRSMYEL